MVIVKKTKLKILWLCYFSNSEIQDQLKPYKRIGEIAPWITNMIQLLENCEDIELHVVSQHKWIPLYESFEKNRIHYHFINTGIPLIGRQWPGFFRFDMWTNNFQFNWRVNRIAKRIKPDIIHMHGAENTFCSSIMQFLNKYPVLITIQGFVSKSLSQDKVTKGRSAKEIEIIKSFKHFGYRTQTMGKDVQSINPNAFLHWHHYPINSIQPIHVEKRFDLVFFGRIHKDKGIEDLLKAVAILKENKPTISLCVIGGGNTTPYKEMADQIGISNNVHWAGFQPTQQDVHKLASSARVSVLPTYHDIISGTIIESLFLKIPVVAYDVGSIHEVNEIQTIITLVEKGNIKGLAEAIHTLLNDEKLVQKISENGYKRAAEMFVSNKENDRKDILKAYNRVIADFEQHVSA